MKNRFTQEDREDMADRLESWAEVFADDEPEVECHADGTETAINAPHGFDEVMALAKKIRSGSKTAKTFGEARFHLEQILEGLTCKEDEAERTQVEILLIKIS